MSRRGRIAALGLTLGLMAPGALRGQASDTSGYRAARIELRAAVDPREAPDEITVGDRFWIAVTTHGPAGYYLLPESVVQAYAARPEMAVFDRDRQDGRLRLKVALFRPGKVTLPTVRARILTDTGDTLAVPVVSDTIDVTSVLAPGDTVLADIKPVWPRAGVSGWVWIALAAVLIAAAFGVWAWRRRRTSVVERPFPRPAADPYAAARERIAALGREPADAEGRIVAAAGIGDALRDYLTDAWGVPARERTTFELLGRLPGALDAERPALGAVFRPVDLAKFARLDPGAGAVGGLSARALDVLDRLEAERRSPVGEPAAEEVAS